MPPPPRRVRIVHSILFSTWLLNAVYRDHGYLLVYMHAPDIYILSTRRKRAPFCIELADLLVKYKRGHSIYLIVRKGVGGMRFIH